MNDSFSNFCKTQKTDHVNISRPFIMTLKQDLIFKDIADIWEFASTSRNLDMLLALQADWEIKFAKIKIQSNGWEDLFKETYGLKAISVFCLTIYCCSCCSQHATKTLIHKIKADL